jgi:NAD(P)H dehydrogenase (quinone)
MNKILITGATGKLGSRVIAHLLKKGSPDQIVALVKDPDKSADLISKGVEVRYGNYADKTSLDAAMKGIRKVLLISGNDLLNRFTQHGNVIDAAKANGVEYIAYTSISVKNMHTCYMSALTGSHSATEFYLKASGLNYAILRNTLYADDLAYYIGWKDTFFNKGILFNAGNGKAPFALREEMAEAFANLILQESQENSIYEIGNSKAFSFAEIAEELSMLTKRQIPYVDNDPLQQAAIFHEMTFPAHITVFLINTGEDIRNGQYDIVTCDLERLLGRKPASLSRILKEVFVL